MAFVRTQIYLEPEQHLFLKEEAKRQGISIAELLRRILDSYVQQTRPKEDFAKIVALGRSGLSDVSEKHDKYLAKALSDEHVR